MVLTKADGLKPAELARKQEKVGALVRKTSVGLPGDGYDRRGDGMGIPELRAVPVGLLGN
jgi:hypothetical protein